MTFISNPRREDNFGSLTGHPEYSVVLISGTKQQTK